MNQAQILLRSSILPPTVSGYYQVKIFLSNGSQCIKIKPPVGKKTNHVGCLHFSEAIFGWGSDLRIYEVWDIN